MFERRHLKPTSHCWNRPHIVGVPSFAVNVGRPSLLLCMKRIRVTPAANIDATPSDILL